MKLFIAPDGKTFSGIRPGETSENPLAYDQLFVDGALQPGTQVVLLPGVYDVEQSLDLRPFPDVVVYGDGKVIIDGGGTLTDAFRIDNQHTIAGIRFRDVLSRPVVVEDGASDCLVVNCFDYQFNYDVSEGQSFTARNVTNTIFRNLTSVRDGFGISVLTGTQMFNCLAQGFTGPGRPGFIGELLDRFNDTNGWRKGTPTSNFVAQVLDSGFYEGSESLLLISTNTGAAGFVRQSRNVEASLALDLSRADRVFLVINLFSVDGLVVGSDSIRFTFESPGGYVEFDLADTDLDVGLNVLEFDLTAPDVTMGVPDLADIRQFHIDTHLDVSGTVQYGLDHLYALDSSVTFDFNSVELFEGVALLDTFKGANGIEQDTYPPPFESKNIERFQYTSAKDHFRKYVMEGREACPIGAIYSGGHLVTNDGPGHLTFQNHPALGPWGNDETFYDTVLNQPGPEGEGEAISIDETEYTYTAINGETQNLADTTALGEIRDLDDAVGKKFDKVAGSLSVMGVNIAKDSGVEALATAGAIDVSAEYYIPQADLGKILSTGLKIVARSAGGEIFQTKPLTDLHAGWNEILVLFASPEGGSGTFDPDGLTEVDVTLDVDSAENLTGHIVDHLHASKVAGFATAPIDFDASGAPIINLSDVPEGQIARMISEPFLVRSAKDCIRAVWCALEDAEAGTLINSVGVQQDLGTRTIEVRFSELKFSKYGTPTGSQAQDWTTLSRLSKVLISGTKLWVQVRMTLRNRTNVPVG